jgi:hypothetical protein
MGLLLAVSAGVIAFHAGADVAYADLANVTVVKACGTMSDFTDPVARTASEMGFVRLLGDQELACEDCKSPKVCCALTNCGCNQPPNYPVCCDGTCTYSCVTAPCCES